MACQHCQETTDKEIQRQMKLVGILPVAVEQHLTVQDVIDGLNASGVGNGYEWWFNEKVKIIAFYACDMINVRQVLENGDVSRTETSDALQLLFPHRY